MLNISQPRGGAVIMAVDGAEVARIEVRDLEPGFDAVTLAIHHSGPRVVVEMYGKDIFDFEGDGWQATIQIKRISGDSVMMGIDADARVRISRMV